MKHFLILLNIALFLSAQAQYGLYPGKTGYEDTGTHYEFFMTQQPHFYATFDSSFADWQVIVDQEVVLRKRLKTTDTLKLNVGGMAIIQCKAVFYRGANKFEGHIPSICLNGMDNLDGVQEISEEPIVTPPIISPPVQLLANIEQGILYLTGSGTLVIQEWPFGQYEFLTFSGNFELNLPYEYTRLQVLWDDFPVTDLGIIK